jgi:hypothetical protein
LVSPRVAKQAIAEVLQPIICEMDVVKPWWWARSLSESHRALLWIQDGKGGAFTLQYGISCTWVPHRQANTWRWHRTLKQARPDLWVDRWAEDAPPHRPIDGLRGLAQVRRTAEIAFRIEASRASAWWQSVETVEGVLRESHHQEGYRTVNHFPPPHLVTAFTLAKLGEIDAALHSLARVPVINDADRDSLIQLMEKLP